MLRVVTHSKALTLLLLASMVQFAHPDTIIPDMVTYDPPPFLSAFQPHRDPGDDPLPTRAECIEYLANDSREDHYREFGVAVSRPGMKIGEGYRVTFDPVTDDDLMKLMLERCSGRATNSPKVETTTIAGRKAFRMKCVVPMPQIHEGIIFIFEHLWVPVGPNEVIELTLVGSDEGLLKSVRDSLSTLKITPRKPAPPPGDIPVPQSPTLAVRLGLGRGKKESGNAIVANSFSALFYTGEYFVSVSYNMPVVDSIGYFRSTDPQKLVAAVKDNNTDSISATLVDLKPEEIAAIMSQQAVDTDGAKSEWKELKENRWERADGARAGYDKKHKTLIIAIKEMWPRLENFRDRPPVEQTITPR